MPKDGQTTTLPTANVRNLLGYWRDSLADEDLRGAMEHFDDAVEVDEGAITGNALPVHCREALAQQWVRYRQRVSSGRTEAESRSADEDGTIPVLIALKAVGLRHSHGETSIFGMASDDSRKVFFPLGIWARLAPDGKLMPNPAVPPWLGRKHLSPNEDAPRETPILGEMKTFDAYLDGNPYEPKEWPDVIDWCEGLIETVTGGCIPDGFARLRIARLGVALSMRNPGRQLIQLYDALLAEKRLGALLLRLCSGTDNPIPVGPKLRLASFGAPRGTMTATYGLAPSQSDAVAAYVGLGDGKLLAVNGPPGTGKTTLLQSIIGSEVVQRALQGGEPAVIIGVTTNTEAVKNINRSMNEVLQEERTGPKPVWARRWVPEADTLGLFLPSGSERAVKAAADEGFAFAIKSGSTWSGFPDRERDEGYLARAEAAWLENARATYPGKVFESASGWLELLRQDLKALQSQQEDTQRLLAELSAAEDRWVEKAGSAASDAIVTYIAAERATSAAALGSLVEAAKSAEFELDSALETERRELEQLGRELKASVSVTSETLAHYDSALTFSKRIEAELGPRGLLEILAARIRFLQPIAAARQCARAVDLVSRYPEHRDAYREVFAANAPEQWHKQRAAAVSAAKGSLKVSDEQVSTLKAKIEAMALCHGKRIRELHAALQRCTEAVAAAERNSSATLEGLELAFDKLRRCRSAVCAHPLAQATGHQWVLEGPERPNLEDFNIAADITVRHEMFQKAMRYWEGRWIVETRDLLDARKQSMNLLPPVTQAKLRSGRVGTLAMFRRWCMLTPCLVSTLHSLPKHFRYSSFVGEVGSKKEYASNFLYDSIDLLIMDEAGQVAPHVGVAAFALAKRAVVVGDVHQIEPVVGCTPGTDYGNAAKHGLESLWADGRPASPFLLTPPEGHEPQGSIMRLAQAATSATSIGMEAEPGIFLSEHRRCHRDIIEYCNDLVYKGRLQPRTSPPPKSRPLRPLNWAHVQGVCVRRGGSNLNQTEADKIAAWIALNAQSWTAHYGRPIEEIVAVVAPFRPQADAVRAALTRHSKDLSHIKCGTVHALQGAQRPIVVFSPTYNADTAPRTSFFDRRSNMLNVLVSRAEDSLVVFGDMRLFRRAGGSPSALLGRRIFAEQDNELPGYSSAVDRFSTVFFVRGERISTLVRHREVLQTALSAARPKETITIVSPFITLRAVAADRLDELCRFAIARGTSVEVIFDRYLAFADVKHEGRRAAERMRAAGAAIFAVKAIHNKTLIVGDREIIEGSFNWLSAQRQDGDSYIRHEISWRISGEDAKGAIQMARKELAALGAKW